MRYRATSTALAAIAAVLLWAQPALGASCTTAWVPVAAPTIHGQLVDVSASSTTNVWAVGTWGRTRTLAEHWNGSTWKRVATPNPGRKLSLLSSVVTISPTDAWAVGEYGRQVHAALLLHWNGATWKRVALPSNARRATLNDMAAVSATDIWIVGSTGDLLQTRTLHYDGATWKVIPSLSPKNAPDLLGVAARSATDVWAVGFGMIERWNGTSWHRFTAPGPGAHLNGVATVSATNAWAADGGRSAIDHWNGTSWSSSFTAKSNSSLFAIAASGANDAWAVGTDFGRPGPHPDRLTVAHWNGAHWTQSLLTTTHAAQFIAIALAPGTTTYWAVGDTLLKGFEEVTRIEERC